MLSSVHHTNIVRSVCILRLTFLSHGELNAEDLIDD